MSHPGTTMSNNLKFMSKKRNVQPGLPPATCSASSTGHRNKVPRPQNFYRLVMQLEATPQNSELIHAALAALAKLQPPPEGLAAVIKLETVNMSHYLRPRTPNEKS